MLLYAFVRPIGMVCVVTGIQNLVQRHSSNISLLSHSLARQSLNLETGNNGRVSEKVFFCAEVVSSKVPEMNSPILGWAPHCSAHVEYCFEAF